MIDHGTRTLFVKEVRRFLRVPGQTVLAPIVTTMLYLFVFGVAMGGRMRMVGDVPYVQFIVPGLVLLGVLSNAFLNTASSMMVMKIQGTLVDILVTPLRYMDIAGAMIAAAALRGLLVGLLTWLVGAVLTGFHVAHPLYAIAVPVLASVGLAAMGLLNGIWADKFEQVNVVPTFILTPLIFLAGVFYDVGTLPPALRILTHANPIFYLVEGLRYGLLGISHVDPTLGLVALFVADVGLVAVCALLLRSGWKLRG